MHCTPMKPLGNALCLQKHLTPPEFLHNFNFEDNFKYLTSPTSTKQTNKQALTTLSFDDHKFQKINLHYARGIMPKAWGQWRAHLHAI